MFAQADALVVHTKDSHQQVLQHYPQVIPDRIYTIPLIAEQVHIPPDATREKARAELGMNMDTPMLLFFGNIKHYKGVDLLPEIFRLTRNIYPDLQLWVVGRPDTEQDTMHLETLKTLDGVQVVDRFIPYEDIWRYHIAADIAIYPYRDIFQSAALTAGLSFGCPVVVTNVGGLPEGVDGNGWVVPPENPQAFVEALIEALSDRERLQTMRVRSRQIIEERFGETVIAHQHINLYQALLKKPVS